MSEVEILIKLIGTCVLYILILNCSIDHVKSKQIRDVIEKSIQVTIIVILLLIITLIWVV